MKACKTIIQALGVNPEIMKSKKRTFRFLDLPLEIRMMVYEYALVVGHVFSKEVAVSDKRHMGSLSYERPATQLFLVCRQIKRECEPIFFSRNHFVIPVEFVEWQCHFLLDTRFKEFVRSMDVSFDMRASLRDRAELGSSVEKEYDDDTYIGAFNRRTRHCKRKRSTTRNIMIC